jgi:nitroimidazol reductase NimA-like FMN-containing flavoprotein (pyridoxamine 5'-phosphate oxidase superfamily)
MVYDGRNCLEVLDREESLRLLDRRCVGRVGFVADGEPVVLPVNYVVDGDSVVFRTASGSKLDAALTGATLAFEVDDIDARHRGGWSVLVRGPARLLTDAERDAAARLAVRPWAHAVKPHYVRIDARRVSGRRL